MPPAQALGGMQQAPGMTVPQQQTHLFTLGLAAENQVAAQQLSPTRVHQCAWGAGWSANAAAWIPPADEHAADDGPVWEYGYWWTETPCALYDESLDGSSRPSRADTPTA